MVEEIRSLLLNSPKYGDSVYFPDDYRIRELPSTLNEFRSAVLGFDGNLDLEAWRASILTEAIYRDRQLSELALSNFDSRTIPNKNTLPSSLDPSVDIFTSDARMIIDSSNVSGDYGSVGTQEIFLNYVDSSTIGANIVSNGSYSFVNLSFNFGGGSMSGFQGIPGTPLKVAFSNVSSVPSDFQATNIKISYPYKLDINKVINRVNQVANIEGVIYLDPTSSSVVAPLYSTVTREHQRLLLLVIAYAIAARAL